MASLSALLVVDELIEMKSSYKFSLCAHVWQFECTPKHQGFQLFVDSYREICIDVYVSKTDGALMWSEASCTVCWSCHSLKSRLWDDDICGQEVHKELSKLQTNFNPL
jgi:hypothetical protein